MGQSLRRKEQRRLERQCARRGHLKLIETGPGLARCANCGDTVSTVSRKLPRWQRERKR